MTIPEIIHAAIARVTASRAADTVLADLAAAGYVVTPVPEDVRTAIEAMLNGLDTGKDRNVVRRWLAGVSP